MWIRRLRCDLSKQGIDTVGYALDLLDFTVLNDSELEDSGVGRGEDGIRVKI